MCRAALAPPSVTPEVWLHLCVWLHSRCSQNRMELKLQPTRSMNHLICFVPLSDGVSGGRANDKDCHTGYPESGASNISPACINPDCPCMSMSLRKPHTSWSSSTAAPWRAVSLPTHMQQSRTFLAWMRTPAGKALPGRFKLARLRHMKPASSPGNCPKSQTW